jgi:hypothetical protein
LNSGGVDLKARWRRLPSRKLCRRETFVVAEASWRES